LNLNGGIAQMLEACRTGAVTELSRQSPSSLRYFCAYSSRLAITSRV
jgi:hypothetical protein